jgi:flagellar basal body-associated protein FliL
MADEAPPAEAPKKKKGLPKTLILVVGVAVLEAGVFFAVFKMGGSGPEPAHGEGAHVTEPEPNEKPAGIAEIQVAKNFRVPNTKSGRTYIYDMDISIVVPLAEKERLDGVVKENAAAIGDRVARIIRGASERVLGEDDLRALREQLCEGLREIVNDDTAIERVLIPRFVPLRSE